MTFADAPTEVSFVIRLATSATTAITGYDRAEDPLDAVFSAPATYTTAGGTAFREQTVTISRSSGVARVTIEMSGIIVLIDDVLIGPVTEVIP